MSVDRYAPGPLLRDALRFVSTSPPARAIWRSVLDQQPLILTYHRFPSIENGFRGSTTPEVLRQHLMALQRARCSLVGLPDLVEAFHKGRGLPPRSVAITVDDGYRDFLTTAMPVFREFRAPVTVFLCTRFVGGEFWLWWDRIEAALEAAGADGVSRLARTPWADSWRTTTEMREVVERIAVKLEPLETTERERQVEAIEAALGVTPPRSPTPGYEALTWDEVRSLEEEGVRFGPHTATHPILSRSGDDRARAEIEESWAVTRAKVRHPVPVAAYPNGSDFTWGAREQQYCREVGLSAAVTTQPRFVRPGARHIDPFAIPRAGAPSDILKFLQLVGGPEYARHHWRGWV